MRVTGMLLSRFAPRTSRLFKVCTESHFYISNDIEICEHAWTEEIFIALDLFLLTQAVSFLEGIFTSAILWHLGYENNNELVRRWNDVFDCLNPILFLLIKIKI